ncbi:MAG: tetratricopeptide repeat protein [Pseudodesulfovibrio sp.]
MVIQAVNAGARRPDALLHTAGRLLEQGRQAQAVAVLKSSLRNLRTVAPGLAGEMAGLLDSRGLSGEALELLLQTDPNRRNQEERLHLADLLRRHERYSEALDEYDAILREDPANAEASLRKVETLAWKGDLHTALPLARDLVRVQPENRSARLLLARILSWDGRVEEAEAEYKRLLGEQQ